ALREGAVGDPLAALTRIRATTAPDALAGGLVQLLAGDVVAAAASLRRARDRGDTSPTVAVAAHLALAVATFLAGPPDPEPAGELERAAAALDVPFLTRLCHAAYGMVTGDGDLVAGVVADCEHRGDRAGAAVAAVLGALGAVWGPGAPRPVGPEAVE